MKIVSGSEKMNWIEKYWYFIMLLAGLINLAIVGGLIYIVMHFVLKYW